MAKSWTHPALHPSLHRILVYAVALGISSSTASLRAQARLVKDINSTPIATRSFPRPERQPRNAGDGKFLISGSRLYYSASVRDGREPYFLDLLTKKPSQLNNIAPGSYSSDPRFLAGGNGAVLLLAYDSYLSDSLFLTRGTPGSLRKITSTITLNGVMIEAAPLPGPGTHFVLAVRTGLGRELWITDGTPKGTRLLKDIYPGGRSSAVHGFQVSGKYVFFFADDGVHGAEPWVTDGTAQGTRMLADVEPGAQGSNPEHYYELAPGVLLSQAKTKANGTELYLATKNSYKLVSDLFPGPSSGVDLSHAAVLNGKLIFRGTTARQGSEPWISNGSKAGTTLLSDIHYGVHSGDFLNPVRSGSLVYFQAKSPYYGLELYRTDGSSHGTQIVKDLTKGPSGNGYQEITSIGNGRVLFVPGNLPDKLFLSDGTASGTRMIKDLRHGYLNSILHLTDSGRGYAVFVADDGSGPELWISDGSTAGTKRIPAPGYTSSRSLSSGATPLISIGSRVFLAADDGKSGSELWESDGTANGTKLFLDINPGKGSSNPGTACMFKNGFVFSAYDPVHGNELWFSDGTRKGTRLLVDIYPGPKSSKISRPSAIGGKLWFSAIDPKGAGRELWSSDGTASGTKLFLDLPGYSGAPYAFTPIGPSGDFLFISKGVMYRSDGTHSGTKILLDSRNWTHGSWWMRGHIGGKALFLGAAYAYPHAQALFLTDGSVSGSSVFYSFKKLTPHLGFPGGIVRNSVVFPAAAPKQDSELYVTDGTTAGTKRISNLNPSGWIYASDFHNLGTRHVLFTAFTPKTGSELYVTDATSQGTRLLLELNKGYYSSTYSAFLPLGNKLYMGVEDGNKGTELWVMDLGATSTEFGPNCGSSLLHADDPVLGKSTSIHGEHKLPSNSSHVLLLGTIAEAPFPRVASCYSYLDLGKPLLPLLVTSGNNWQRKLTIPNSPSLTGARLGLQCWSIVPSGKQTLVASNGIDWALGH